MPPEEALAIPESRELDKAENKPTEWDAMDKLGLWMLAPEFGPPTSQEAAREAAKLIKSGGIRETGRVILANDLVLSRAHTRAYQALLDVEVDRLGRKSGDLKRAKVLGDLVDKQHRRMCASMER